MIQKFLVFTLLFGAAALHRLQAQTNGVQLLDTLNRAHGISAQNTKFSACWGWVSPDGREYAFIGTYTGTSIIDLNVSPIREIGFVAGPPATYCYREMKTYKNYLYIVSEGGRGVQIVNLARLPDTTGMLVREFNFVNGTRNTLRSHTVTLADGHLYLNGSAGWSPGGVVIFDLRSDPTNPQFVGEYSTVYIHDSYVRNDTLYGAAIYSGTNSGLHVVDVRSKTAPVLMRRISYNGSGTHHCWATINGRYALTTDEIGSVNNLKIWDMQNLGGGPPYTPLAQYQASPADIIHNVHGRGYYAYISHYTAGMRVVDVRNPAAPVEVGRYDTYPGPSGGYAGCWAVYPYYPSGRWIGSDMQTGLYLCNFNGLAPRIRSPLLAPANNDTMRAGVAKTFRWRAAASQADDPHRYELRIWGHTVDTTLTTRDTSLTIFPISGMQNGRVYQWHVWIKDEYTEVSSRDTFRIVYASSATDVGDESDVPRQFRLSQNYPNPFNPSTTIEYALPTNAQVSLKLYNALGEEVKELVNEMQTAGVKSVRLNAENLPSGVYLYKLVAGTFRQSKKMILIR